MLEDRNVQVVFVFCGS